MEFKTFQRNMFRTAACLHRSGIHPLMQKWATNYTALPERDQRFLYEALSGNDGSDRQVVERMFSSFGVHLKFPYLGSLLRKGSLRKVGYSTPEQRQAVCEAITKALSGKRCNMNDDRLQKGVYFVDMVLPCGDEGWVWITRESSRSGVFLRYEKDGRKGIMLDADTYISR